MTLIKVGALCTIPLTGIPQTTFGDSSAKVSEQPTAQTELFPRYPKDSICPALTSLFGSTKDLNGAMRMEPGGVDGGRNGDIVISPADGILLAVWKIGTGREVGWNVLIQHDARDLNLGNYIEK